MKSCFKVFFLLAAVWINTAAAKTVDPDCRISLTYIHGNETLINNTHVCPTGRQSADLGSYRFWCVGELDQCSDSGLTVQLWIKPDPVPYSEPKTILVSNGGHLPYSNGFYLSRRFGDQYQFGFSHEGDLWAADFRLASGHMTHVAGAWSRDSGINVYVNGFLETTEKVPETRSYSKPDFDPQSHLQIGDGRNEISFAVDSISIENGRISMAEIQSNIESRSLLWMGCRSSPVTILPESHHAMINISSESINPISFCRQQCYQQGQAIVQVFLEGMQCSCLGLPSIDATTLEKECAISSSWAMYLVKPKPVETPFTLIINETKHENNNKIFPYDMVEFDVAIEPFVDIAFEMKFDDATSQATAGKTSHWWSESGVYTIEAHAQVGMISVTKQSTVEVVPYSDKKSPERAVLSTSHLQDHRKMHLQTDVADELSTSCNVDFDDNSTDKSISLDNYVDSFSMEHVYELQGKYDINVACENEVGEIVESVDFFASTLESSYVYQSEVESFSFDLHGDYEFLSGVRVELKPGSENATISLAPEGITILESNFESGRKHAATAISKTGHHLKTFFLDVQSALTEPSLTVSTLSGEVDSEVRFTLSFPTGGPIHVRFKYGMDKDEYFTIDSSSGNLEINRTEMYTVLGYYPVLYEISNDISYIKHEQVVSIEQPIVSMEIMAVDITSLASEIPIEVNLNMGTIPPQKVSFKFDYGDGHTENLEYKNPRHDTFAIFKHSHRYENWGFYPITVTSSNKISSMKETRSVQVGQHLAHVDLSLVEDRVALTDYAVIIVACPVGSDVTYDVDLGDGTTFTIPESAFKKNASDESLKTNNETQALFPEHVVNGVFKYSTADRGTALTLTSSRTLRVYHRYPANGAFSVTAKVSNKFNSVSTHLCPDVIVGESINNCTAPQLLWKTGLTNGALNKYRSEDIMIEASGKTGLCDGGKLRYTWKLSRVEIKENEVISERPYPDICHMTKLSRFIQLPALSLTYGSYRMTVTSSPGESQLSSTSISLILHINPSYPIAMLSGEKKKSFFIQDNTIIDYSESRDPDLARQGKIGLSFFLFCIRDQNKNDLLGRSWEEIQTESTEVKSKILFKETTQNAFHFLDAGGCFTDKTIVSAKDKFEIRNEKLTFPTTLFNPESLGFFMTLMVCKEGRCSNYEQTITVRTSDTKTDLSKIDDLLLSGDTGAALNIISTLSVGLDEVNITEEEQAETRNKLINVLETVSTGVKDTGQILQAASALKTITKTNTQVSQSGRKTAASVVSNLVNGVADDSKNKTMDEVTKLTDDVLGITSNLLPTRVMSKFLLPMEMKDGAVFLRRRKRAVENDDDDIDEEEEARKAEASKLKLLKNSIDLRNPGFDRWKWMYLIILDHSFPDTFAGFPDLIDYTDPGDLEDGLLEEIRAEERKKNEEKTGANKAVAQNSFGAVDNLSNMVMSRMPEKGQMSMKSAKLSLTIEKMNVNDTDEDDDDDEVENMKKGYKVPGNVLKDVAGANGDVGITVLDSASNQFSYAKGSKAVTGGVKTLALKDKNGKPLVVKDTSKPILIPIKGGSAKKIKEVIHKFPNGTPGAQNSHPINLTDPNLSIFVLVRPLDQNDKLKISFTFNEFLNESNSFYTETIPKDEKDIGTEYATYDKTTRDRLRYTVIPPAKKTAVPGIYRVTVTLLETRIKIDSEDIAHNYSLSLTTYGCLYFNATLEAWSSDGCNVSPLSAEGKALCRCNHLTSFGGNFVVPPNTIDFNTVWAKFKDLDENAAVFGTVISILILYIILLIWGRYMDKKDVVKWGATPLEDNLPTDTYHYQLTAQTGTRKRGETESRVSFIISGDRSDSGVRKLYDGKRKIFERGSIMNFVLSVETPLGPLNFLRIWHDNSGKGDKRSWFLDQIQLVDLQTGDKFIFLVDRWLAVEEDDGQIERIVPIAGINDLVQFQHLFSSSARKKLSNEHLWVSVFSRPTRSHFSRVQRISCCLSLLFLTMITNAMWFKTDDKLSEATALRVGPFSFTLQQVFISFASTMIVFPVNFLLITIFRRSRPKRNAVVQKNQEVVKRSQKYKWKNISTGSGIWSNARKRSRAQKFGDSIRKMLKFHQKKVYSDELCENDRKYIGNDDAEETKKKKAWSFPHWVLYIGWILVFFSVVTSAFFTILYSMEWGAEKANEWLTTFLLSFFQSVIVVQPFKVLLIVAFIACVLKKPDIGEEDFVEDDDNIPSEEERAAATNSVNITAIMLQRKQAAEELRPPDMASLEASREVRMKEVKMETIIKEIAIYSCFVLVLFFISYQTRDEDSFLYANNLKNIFHATNGGQGVKTITSIEAFWKWMNVSFLPAMYAQTFLNGQRLKWWDKRCIVDLVSRRIGVGRLRQMRIKEDSCTIRDPMTQVINHCRDAYSWTDDDTKTYLTSWKLPSDVNHNSSSDVTLEDMKKTPWDYRNSLQLKNAPYLATISLYKGGGYVASFKRGIEETSALLEKLQNESWLDLRTRAVFVEFTLYNPNVNLFSSMIFTIEFPSQGAAVPRTEFKVYRLFSYVGAFAIIVILFEVIFVCFTIYFLVHSIKCLRKERCGYFNNFWRVLEFAVLVTALVSIAMYAVKHILTAYSISSLHASGSGEFINFQSLALYDETFVYVVGCLVFMATIQFLKLLQFNRRMGMMGDTIKLAFKDLKAFIVVFVVVFLSFCQLGSALFGTVLSSYGNFAASIETMFAFVLGDFDFHAMQGVARILGPIFFFAYVCIVYIALMGIFLTIIAEAFAHVKADTNLQSNEHEIVDFIWKRCKGLLGVK